MAVSSFLLFAALDTIGPEIAELRIKAKPLGIHKIEGGPKGGRIIFSKQPNVDVAKLIQLIQTEPKRYKLDGQEKLRFTENMPDAVSRIECVDRLLDRLT